MQTKRRLYALVFIATIVCAGVGVCTKAVAADTANIIELTLGKKHWIGESHYVICRFDKKPQLGTAILKIQIFTKDGRQDTSFEVRGEADMPAMRGSHRTGEQPVKMNKKGDYLFPIPVVMPGEWEAVLQLYRDKKHVMTGRIKFSV